MADSKPDSYGAGVPAGANLAPPNLAWGLYVLHTRYVGGTTLWTQYGHNNLVSIELCSNIACLKHIEPPSEIWRATVGTSGDYFFAYMHTTRGWLHCRTRQSHTQLEHT